MINLLVYKNLWSFFETSNHKESVNSSVTSISLLCLNTQSIRNKTDLLTGYLADKSLDILCFAEHWLYDEETEPFIVRRLQNYLLLLS